MYKGEGHGPNEARQEGSHIHFAEQTPDLDYIVTVDLGADVIRTFKFSDEGLELYETLEVQAEVVQDILRSIQVAFTHT